MSRIHRSGSPTYEEGLYPQQQDGSVGPGTYDKHSWGVEVGPTEDPLTISTWEDIGRFLCALSAGLAHFDLGATMDGWEGFSGFE